GLERAVEPTHVGRCGTAGSLRARDVEGGEVLAAAAPPGVLRCSRLAGDAHLRLAEGLAVRKEDPADGRQAGGGVRAVAPLVVAGGVDERRREPVEHAPHILETAVGARGSLLLDIAIV